MEKNFKLYIIYRNNFCQKNNVFSVLVISIFNKYTILKIFFFTY